MGYCTDGGGTAFKCNDMKIFSHNSTWSTKLSQIGKVKGKITIITYSLPNIEYTRRILKKKSKDVYIIAHLKFYKKAMKIKEEFPDVNIALHNSVHSKVVTIEPITTYFSSANFGSSGWHESSIGFHSKEIHDDSKKDFESLWKQCEILNEDFDVIKILKEQNKINKKQKNIQKL